MNPKLAKLIKSAKMTMTRHSPEILTGVGIAGMITSTVLAVKATPKAIRLIDAAKEEAEVDKLTPVETVRVAWKCYIPAAVTGVASVACLIGASSQNIKRNAALATAYKLSEKALAEYREQVVETVGEKKEQSIREKIAQKQIDNVPVSTSEIYITGTGDTLCLDPLNDRLFKSNIDKIRKAENMLNKEMIHGLHGYVSLNEFYNELGLKSVETGELLGWNTDHLIDLNITAGLTEDEEPCLVIGHYNPPKYKYDRF